MPTAHVCTVHGEQETYFQDSGSTRRCPTDQKVLWSGLFNKIHSLDELVVEKIMEPLPTS